MPGNLKFPIPMTKNITMAAAAMPIAAMYKNFIFTVVFFAFAHALKLSINPKCLYYLSQKLLTVQYHKAAQIGRERAQKAQMRLFDYTGFAMLTYTVKQGMTGFEPVGEEQMAGKLTRGDEMMLFICDKDGYAKAQSKPVPMKQGEEAFKKMLVDGIQEFTGEIKTVS
jgi:hypothetical protein